MSLIRKFKSLFFKNKKDKLTFSYNGGYMYLDREKALKSALKKMGKELNKKSKK